MANFFCRIIKNFNLNESQQKNKIIVITDY
jgi:hypothetical protein